MTKKHQQEILSTTGDTKKKVEAKQKKNVIEVVPYAYLRQAKVGGWLGWSWVCKGHMGWGHRVRFALVSIRYRHQR